MGLVSSSSLVQRGKIFIRSAVLDTQCWNEDTQGVVHIEILNVGGV